MIGVVEAIVLTDRGLVRRSAAMQIYFTAVEPMPVFLSIGSGCLLYFVTHGMQTATSG